MPLNLDASNRTAVVNRTSSGENAVDGKNLVNALRQVVNVPDQQVNIRDIAILLLMLLLSKVNFESERNPTPFQLVSQISRPSQLFREIADGSAPNGITPEYASMASRYPLVESIPTGLAVNFTA